jgi:hypothetical protein
MIFRGMANLAELFSTGPLRLSGAPRRAPMKWRCQLENLPHTQSSLAATKRGADALARAGPPPVRLFLCPSGPTRGSAAGQVIGVKISAQFVSRRNGLRESGP